MTEQFRYTDERFADIQMLRYRLDGFEALTLRQKLYIYYLAKATLCGRDITTDQFGRYNLRIRKVLETIYKRYEGDRTTEEYKALETYLKRVWFSNGIHHHYGCEKFVPAFTEEYFRLVVDCCGCEDENIDELCNVIFDPTVLPKRVNQKAGDDLVQTSACNYYYGVTQQEAERFYDAMRDENDPMPISYGLNSTLRKTADGTLKEDVWHEGGLYGEAIKHITYWLEKASEVAENELQTKIIGMLVDYYRTGDLSMFDAYSIVFPYQYGSNRAGASVYGRISLS